MHSGVRRGPRRLTSAERIPPSDRRRPAAGFESDRVARVDGVPSEHRTLGDRETPPTSAAPPLNEAPLGRTLGHDVPSDDLALVKAIGEASAAGRFDVVALLAGELQARRLSRGGVVALDAKRRERGA